MKKISLVISLIFVVAFSNAQARSDKEQMRRLIKENFELADTQYRYMMTLIAADKMPQSYDEKDKKLISHDIKWWCSGFYSGTLWYIFEQTGNEVIKKEAERALEVIKPNQTYTDNHDLGFMMYCSFGNAYGRYLQDTGLL